MRAWRFAEEFAKQGHQVVLLCAAPEGMLANNSADIAHHDWQRPFILACDSGQAGWLDKNRLPLLARKGATVWRMLWQGGELGGWTENAVRTVRQLAETFRPDVVWATFGMMEAVIAARRIARHLLCPWVLDIKDNWELYVPCGLRRLMVVRTSGWAALTANSRFTQEKARFWQRGEATVVYSGVDEAFFTNGLPERQDDDPFRINLIGGLYFPECLDTFLTGVNQWVAGLAPAERKRVRLCYLGGDIHLFAAAAVRLDIGIAVDALGYRPVEEMARCCRNAAVNAYIAHPGTFHHKLLELLACKRPVLAYPTESEESRYLARQLGGNLLEPCDAREVTALLDSLYRLWHSRSEPPPVFGCTHDYSWRMQTARLSNLLITLRRQNDSL